MKLTASQLRQIIKEEVEAAIVGEEPVEQGESLLVQSLGMLIPSVRAAQLWFHGAHNLTKGVGFSGDHTKLFGEIYPALETHFDDLVEKAVGNTGMEELGCPIHITQAASEILSEMSCLTNKPADQIVREGLDLLQGHHDLLSETYSQLEEAGELPLGLNDLLASQANELETFLYLLQQRAKV
jgi:DNA-binding ferritin-like protein